MLYTREQLAIFDKIDDLAVAKAAVLQYKTMHNLIDNNNDYVYSALVAEADSIRNELIEMGAKPSTEELASLKKSIAEYKEILRSQVKKQEILANELLEIKERFGDERRS